jgi:hypothetical protein
MITIVPDTSRRALRSLTLLIVLEVWKERNARTFDRYESSTAALMAKIRYEASAWIIAGAKELALLVSRE